MAHPLPESSEQHPSNPRHGTEEFATRLFSVIMFGICAVILLMAVFGDW